jgi:hypothetical protein
MRELNTTGYMHNRVRILGCELLCKHLYRLADGAGAILLKKMDPMNLNNPRATGNGPFAGSGDRFHHILEYSIPLLKG